MLYQLECIEKMVISILKKATTFHCILGYFMNSLNIRLSKYQVMLLGLFYTASNRWAELSRVAAKHVTYNAQDSSQNKELSDPNVNMPWQRKHSLHKIMLKVLTVSFIYKPTDFLGNMAFWLCDETKMYQIPLWAF